MVAIGSPPGFSKMYVIDQPFACVGLADEFGNVDFFEVALLAWSLSTQAHAAAPTPPGSSTAPPPGTPTAIKYWPSMSRKVLRTCSSWALNAASLAQCRKHVLGSSQPDTDLRNFANKLGIIAGMGRRQRGIVMQNILAVAATLNEHHADAAGCLASPRPLRWIGQGTRCHNRYASKICISSTSLSGATCFFSKNSTSSCQRTTETTIEHVHMFSLDERLRLHA